LSEKIHRKDLKEPDEFVSATGRMMNWLAAHRLLVIGSIVVAAGAVLAVIGMLSHLESKAMEASRAFVDSFKILNARVVERADADETTQADGTYGSERDKLKAALGAMEAMAKAHGGSPAADLAAFFVAEEKRRLGELDQAIAGFEAYLRTQGLRAVMAPFAVEGLGAALEQQGKLEEARAQYLRLTEEGFAGHKDRGLYHLARLEQKAGNHAQAADRFRAILDEFPQSLFSEEIQHRLAVLPEPTRPKPEKADGQESAGKSAQGDQG
jgi:tetratricopeptide (TPR) repeat protein